MEISQYSIVLVNLDPTIGSEMKKTRPYVVISPIELNRPLNTIVVAPMTSNLRNYPTRVNVFFNNKEGRIAVDQIKTIDKKRVIRILGKIKKKEILKLKTTLYTTYVL